MRKHDSFLPFTSKHKLIKQDSQGWESEASNSDPDKRKLKRQKTLSREDSFYANIACGQKMYKQKLVSNHCKHDCRQICDGKMAIFLRKLKNNLYDLVSGEEATKG